MRTWTIGLLMSAIVFVLMLWAGAAVAGLTSSHVQAPGRGNPIAVPSPERP